MKTQLDWITKQLIKNGYVTRNQCLKRYISRLGARISDMKKDGYLISAGYMKIKNGRDYCYTLLREPKKNKKK